MNETTDTKDAVPGCMIERIESLLWTPVRTKPRQEKKLAEYCASKGVVHYLPLNRKIHRYKRKTAEFLVPMFSGYVFCCLDEDTFSQILLSNAIVYRIRMNESQENQLIEELKAVRAYEILAREREVVVKPELVAGTPVKVVSGPLRGVEGYVTSRKGKTVVTINVELLGQSVSTLIDIGEIERAE